MNRQRVEREEVMHRSQKVDMIAEYDGSNALQRRFVQGPGMDEPLVQYEGTGTTDRRWLHADERGSIIAVSDAAGNVTTINRYDEFGKPQATNAGRFQYTGQMWLGELGLYYYKARAYAPHLGRFLQTDPIGYWDSANLYAYVGNDPVNLTDPWGLQEADGRCDGTGVNDPDCEVIVTGKRLKKQSENPLDFVIWQNLEPVAYGGGGRPAAPGQPEEPEPKPPSAQESLCTAVAGGALTAGSPHYAHLAFHAVRGASVGELIAGGAAAAMAPELLIIGGAVAVIIYMKDRESGGKITESFGNMVGC